MTQRAEGYRKLLRTHQTAEQTGDRHMLPIISNQQKQNILEASMPNMSEHSECTFISPMWKDKSSFSIISFMKTAVPSKSCSSCARRAIWKCKKCKSIICSICKPIAHYVYNCINVKIKPADVTCVNRHGFLTSKECVECGKSIWQSCDDILHRNQNHQRLLL